MTNSELLKAKIKQCGISKGHICKKLDLSYGSLKKKLDGVVDFRLGEVETICNVLNINTMEEKNDIFFASNVEKNSTIKDN